MKTADRQHSNNDFGMKMAEVLTKAELMFELSKILQKHYPSSAEARFTINFKHGDGNSIARCIRHYSSESTVPQYQWLKVENIENTEVQQLSSNTCPPEVVEVLINAVNEFDLDKVFQNSGLLTIQSKNFMFELGYEDIMLGTTRLKCPCPDGVRMCCKVSS